MDRIILDSLLPEFLNPDSISYEKEKVIIAGEYYIFNERAYIKSRLVLEELSGIRGINFLLWVSMESSLFIDFAKDIDSYDGIFSTKLYAEIPFYDETEDMSIDIDFKLMDDDLNPYMIIPDDSPVASLLNDFKFGLSKSKFDEIHDKLYA